ncbi:rapamycin-insensitive companion of mTOR-like isoform X2 [Scleropages formosus]|uniref:rapamycin-insensitive companion of mTOR-like isoform X2 n=1 Tax=Scleropages formosus TaxID=113540 RepID=UPI0008786654|nr:rapamycin-insensitive companion of mTOR-like isoform X2 [Scleropages formosus]
MALSSTRSLRVRGRHDSSGEENVPLDLSREPVDCLREILQNVAKPQGVTNIRKLGHLNNFIRLLCSVGHCEEKFGFTYEQIIICLRLALLSDAKEVRAAGLRALRYLIHDSSVLQKVLRLQVDYLIARCIDIQQSNEVERTQALRLVRKMIAVNALLFPSSIVSSLIAVGSDGRQEHDCMVQACVAIICELALKNPEVVAQKGGLGTILKNVIDCQQNCINEALITTVLHLLNHPYTRQYVRLNVELEQILAPYTDFHYRHNPDTSESLHNEDREARFLACKMAIVASFRSWSGIINLCKPGSSGISSLIGLLFIPHMEVQKRLVELIYDIFWLPIPVMTDNFTEALQSVDPSRYQDSWRLSDGFVASEAMMILPQRVKSRPDLVDNYLALVLSAFINHGLLEGLIEVITSGSDHVSVRATILLGELLHMASRILPQSHSHHLHCLPTLVNLAASFSISQEKSLRASGAVNNLKLFHEKKNNQPKPSSLYLDHIIRKAMTTRYYRDQNSQATRDGFILKDREEAFMMILRDSQVLSHKDNLDWNWALITTVLKWPNVNLRSNKDEQIHKFVRRLLFFYKPSSRLFSCLELSHRKARQLTIAGCQFIEFLLKSKEEGQVYLEDLVRDVAQWLSALDVIADSSFQSKGLLTMLSQHYFLLLGTLSAHPFGVKIMEKCTIFQCLLKLCSVKNQDYLLKLTVSTLDYSRDGLARVVLSKILTAATDSCRLYATKYLRVLLRANVEFFSSWGIELLVTQLHDCTKAISMEALDILNEACEEKANLHALIQMKPALAHLGDPALLLILRFLSIPKGFSYLNERGYVTKQMEKWQQEYNLKYVDLVEEQLNEALATYRRPADKDRMHQSKQSCQRPNVYLPVHLYGELVHDKTGCELLEAQNVVPDLSYTVRSPILDKWEAIKRLKAALWALGNIGSSAWGLNLLQKENVIPDILALAQECEVLSIRGTCLYVLGLISRTKQGCDTLKQQGWDAVRHTQNELWPVVLAEVDPQLSNELPSSLLSLPSESTNMYRNSESMYVFNSEWVEGLPLHLQPKTPKSQSPTLPLARSYLAHGHLLGSLSMSGKKLRSISDPKGNRAGRAIWETTPWGLQRNRALTEPAIVYPSTVNPRAMELGITKDAVWSGPGMRPHGHHSTSSAAYSGGRSHSQSFNTGTTTSGISSMSSSPSHETGTGKSSSASDTDCISLDTMVNSHTVCSRYAHRLQSNQPLLSKSKSTSMVPLSSLDMLPNRTQLFKSSSLAASQSLADCSFTYTSPRDALGYWALKQLQQQRIHPSLSRSEVLASPAKDVLITDTITMKAGGLDSKFTPRRFLSFTCVDKEELLSPINQTILQGSFSIHSTVSIANRRCNDDYIGLALPLDINDMFQLKESSYFQRRIGPLSNGQNVTFYIGEESEDPCHGTPPLKQQGSVTDVLTDGKKDSRWGFTESSLQEHSENCLYCAGLQVLGGQGDGTVCGHVGISTPYADWCGTTKHLEIMPQSGLSWASDCSDSTSQSSASSCHGTEVIIGAKPILEDSITSRALLRKEILRLVVNLSSCVGTKSHEAGLLTIKEKFPSAFDDICLYSEVCCLLARCLFRLTSRRFIQELFQDVHFIQMYEEAEVVLSTPPKIFPAF